MLGRTAREISVGEKASLTRTVGDVHLALFAAATGDVNPLHFDAEYAHGTLFQGRIAHGILSAGLISAVIGNRLPGVGTVYIAQDLRFRAPVRPGDRVTAEVEVLSVDEERNRARLRTTCRTQEGTVVLEGEALVMPPRKPFADEDVRAIETRMATVGETLRDGTSAFLHALEREGDR